MGAPAKNAAGPPPAPTRGPLIPDLGGPSFSEEDSDEGNQTPAPPSPMHLAEQRELVQLSRVVASEALRTPGGDDGEGFLHTELDLVCPPLEGPLQDEGRLEDGTLSEGGLSYSPNAKRKVPFGERGSPRRQTKRRREDEAAFLPCAGSDAAAEGDSATAAAVATAAAAGARASSVRMPVPPPPKVCASAARYSAKWYGGICCAPLPSANSEETCGDSTGEQGDTQGAAVLPVGPPGQVEGETKPVFCPICNGLYKELPGGGPGDGLHWIGCDCTHTSTFLKIFFLFVKPKVLSLKVLKTKREGASEMLLWALAEPCNTEAATLRFCLCSSTTGKQFVADSIKHSFFLDDLDECLSEWENMFERVFLSAFFAFIFFSLSPVVSLALLGVH